ncbi:MAG: TetR/AcrR family transcriptional regulator [bacterium]
MTRRRASTDTWERILGCAEDLFARQGYDGTSTRQIAARAGISIQTLQYHCAGKKNLYKAVLERTVIPVTDQINRYVDKMLERDLKDVRVLEESLTRIIDELFDLLHGHPNYAPLFYRQWLVEDPDLRSVEWESLVPVLRRWSKGVEARLDEERLRGTNLFLLFLSLSWMYWGLFVQPQFIARYMGMDPDSPDFLSLLKGHAWEMTLRMMEQRRSSFSSPFQVQARTGRAKATARRSERKRVT